LLAGSLGLIVYTFAGYPALMALWARTRPRPVDRDLAFLPRVSLIIPAYNEEAVIEERLRNAFDLDYPPDRLEVMVVADGSDDATRERAASVAGVHVLYQPERRGKLAAMNHGAQRASGEILIFSDANNRYARGALRALVAPFADPGVGMVTGRKSIDDGSGRPLDRAEGLYWRYESQLKVWESAVGSVVGAAGEIVAFRREAYEPAPAGTMNEDLVQSVMVATNGWRVVYAPDAVSLERASATIGDEATRRSRLVTGRWQALVRLLPGMVRRNPVYAWQVLSHKGLRPLVPWALATTAASNAQLARSRAWARWLAGGQLVFYAAAALGRHDEQAGRRRTLTYLPYYFCRMNLATLNGVWNFGSGRHEHVWARVRRG
jgi:cellulose synthase/poly-beta-1,6-N-acetylglucosamine synthase-like glycosyltransferase